LQLSAGITPPLEAPLKQSSVLLFDLIRQARFALPLLLSALRDADDDDDSDAVVDVELPPHPVRTSPITIAMSD
jgi:hypothetical protein